MNAENARTITNLAGALIGLLLVLILGIVVIALCRYEIPAANQSVFLVVIGSLTANITAMVAFFYGSSASDKAKSDTINTQANALATAATNATPPDAKPAVVLKAGEEKAVKAEPAPANPPAGETE